MKFYKNFGLSTFATLSSVGASFLFNKIFSVFYGPAGLTLLSHLQNILAILHTIPQEGINRGLIKFTSEASEESPNRKIYFTNALLLQGINFLFSVPILYFLLRTLPDLSLFLQSKYFFLLAVVGFLLQSITYLLLSILLSKQKLIIYSLITIFNNVVAIGLVYFGSTKSIFVASCFLWLGPSAGLLLLFFKRSEIQLSLVNINLISKEKIYDIFKFISIAISVLVFGRLVDYFIRVYVIEQFSATSTGYWQAAVKLSDGYTPLFSGIIGVTFFPQLSGLINENRNIKTFFQSSCIRYLAIVYVGLGIVFIFKEVFLTILFDDSFLPANQFLILQIIGDFFKFPSWLIVYIILAEGKTKLYIYLQLFSAVLYIILIFYFTSHMNLIGVGYAHIYRFLIYFLVVLILYRKKIF